MALPRESLEEVRRAHAMHVLFRSGRFTKQDLADHYRLSVAHITAILSRKPLPPRRRPSPDALVIAVHTHCVACKTALENQSPTNRYGLCRPCRKKYITPKMQGSSRCREIIRIREKHTCSNCGWKWEPGAGRRLDIVARIGVEGAPTDYRRQYIPLDMLHLFTAVCHSCNLGGYWKKRMLETGGRKHPKPAV